MTNAYSDQTQYARVIKARTLLLTEVPPPGITGGGAPKSQPWFGQLALRLNLFERAPSICPTFQTDGTVLEYSAQFAARLTMAELKAVWAHEVLHCALGHVWRLGTRDARLWNEACDYVINLMLVDAGFTLPKGVLFNRDFAGLSADVVYAKLKARARQQQQQQQQQQTPDPNGAPAAGQQQQQQTPNAPPPNAPANTPGTPDPNAPATDDGASNAFGRMVPPPPNAPVSPAAGQQQPTPADAPPVMTQERWQFAAEQATNVSKKWGNSPGGGVPEALDANKHTALDWRAILAEYFERSTVIDTSWQLPNNRFIARGLYMPGKVRENMARAIAILDSSCSVSKRDLDLGFSELSVLMREFRPEALDVITCDTRVNNHASFSPDDCDDIDLCANGRGGTRFAPAFDYIEREDLAPAFAVYFTDLESPDLYALDAPDYPVLWITPEDCTIVAPFGETVRIPAE